MTERCMENSAADGFRVSDFCWGHGGDDRHHPFRANELTAGYDYAAFGHIHKAAQLIPNRGGNGWFPGADRL